jgi:branched-chain amino acid transport system ATP-binding protein
VTAVLQLEQLDVRYGGVPAVRGLDLRLEEGEIVGLIGANGAGKSTTLHAIMGLVPPQAGDVRLLGSSIRGRAPEAVARAGVALVPEGRRIYPNLTVEENLRLGLAGRRAREGADRDIAWVHELFPIVHEFGERPAGALSGGQQQQLAIARGLVAGPDLLLLDEPSLGLAPQLVDTVFQTLASIRERGVTVLVVEHDMGLVMNVCDEVVVLSYGEVIADADPAAVQANPDVVRVYLGEDEAC